MASPPNLPISECPDCDYDPALRRPVRCAHLGEHYISLARVVLFDAIGAPPYVVETSFAQPGADRIEDSGENSWFHGPLSQAEADVAFALAEDALRDVV